MEDKFGKLGRCGLLAAIVSMLELSAASGVSVAAESSVTKSSEHVATGTIFRCEKNKKLLVDSYDVPVPLRYRSVALVYDCDKDQHVVALTDKTNRSAELDRFRAVEGAKVKVKLLEAAGKEPVDLAIVTYGFEPASDDQLFLVDVYRLDVSKKVFSVWSSLPPRIEDLNGNGTQELVVYEDLFSIKRPNAPNWPRVFELSSSIKTASLSRFRPLLMELKKQSVLAVDAIKKTCQTFGSKPCPLESSIVALKNQLTAIDALLVK